jgi:hypothetical protein
MERNTLWQVYLNALELGVSDPRLAWPEVTEPLAVRMDKLISNIKEVQHTSSPLLITHEWLENASRIKRRVLANGGGDRSFFVDIETCLGGWDYFDDDITTRLRIQSANEDLKDYFMFNNEGFTADFFEEHPKSRQPAPYKTMVGAISKALDEYSNEPEGTWKHNLYNMKEQVIAVVMVRNKLILSDYVWILDFDRSSSLWKKRVRLGALNPTDN